MSQLILDALVDTSKMIPLLLLVYIGIEFLEFKYGSRIRQSIQKAGKTGPAIASVVGAIPQCGFSVIGTALYNQKLVTIGTLIAVYVATSDEAIPIILSEPGRSAILIPLIFTKIIMALTFGFIIDLIFKKTNSKILSHVDASAHNQCQHNHTISEEACCGHTLSDKPNYKEMFIHPIFHTIKIASFVFITTLILNILFDKIGNEGIAKIFLGHSIFQPFIAAIFGLIPNCAASVAITELYLKGVLSYGSAIAGLSSGAGLGLLILFRENKDLKKNLTIVGILLFVSIFSGVIIQLFS